MTAHAIIGRLHRLGVEISASGGKLKLRAAPGVITPALKDLLSERKDELLPLVEIQWGKRASDLLSRIEDDHLRLALRDQFEERAAICEYDGNLSRDEAERVAYEELKAAAKGVRR